MTNKEYSFDTYQSDVLHAFLDVSEWRLGQAYFNVLSVHRPGLAALVWGTDADPFYRKASELSHFLTWVQERW
jgi:hypothetical protein